MANVIRLLGALALGAGLVFGGCVRDAAADEREQLLRRALHALAAADWPAVETGLDAVERLDPAHPAASLYRTEARLWQLAWDQDDTRFDAEIRAGLDEVVELSDARLGDDPEDAEANFYRGYAGVLRARFHLMRGSFLRAGFAGEEGRRFLERALAAAPSDPRIDADTIQFPLGIYYYYADILPSVLSWLGWLPFVPTGDRERGLAYLESARNDGGRHHLFAAPVLVEVWSEFEDRPEEAAALLVEMRREFPRNVDLSLNHMFLLLRMERYEESLAVGKTILSALGDSGKAPVYETLANVWRARAKLHRGELDEAGRMLEPYAERDALRPPWAKAYVTLALGQIEDARGRRPAARALYERVTELEDPEKSIRAARLAKTYLEDPFRVAVRTAAR